MFGADVKNWQEIVKEHGPSAYQAAWRILGHTQDCEDVLQEVFIEAYKFFVAGKVQSPKAFLYRMVTFRALDALRRRKDHLELDASRLLDRSQGPLAQVVQRDEDLRLRTIVAELPSQQAAVFCLTYSEELSADEIALALEISTNAVGLALHKARAKLQDWMLKESKRNRL
jgi:RNA polymerase sigma-70 factor (ECF subfamily)